MFEAFAGGAEYVTEYVGWIGKLWGECAICGRPLSDAESRKNGIGPTCMARLRKEHWWASLPPPPPPPPPTDDNAGNVVGDNAQSV
jgi:hypothetical protein